MYRTATGQTGKTAYQFEIQQIINAKRDLEYRLARLISIIVLELPDNATSHWQMTAGHEVDIDKATIVRMIELWRGSIDPVALETIEEIIKNLEIK